jgi:hypothetical protein
VLLATVGYYTVFGNNSLLTEYRPDLLHLQTTNALHIINNQTADMIAYGHDEWSSGEDKRNGPIHDMADDKRNERQHRRHGWRRHAEGGPGRKRV